MNRAAGAMVIGLAVLLAALAPVVAAAPGGVEIAHTPPDGAPPGQQIDLVAVLRNATSASVAWNNGSLPKPALLPMTNLSRAQGRGWAYEAWLPAQPDGTQVSYSITATGPAGSTTVNYTLLVGTPALTSMTPAAEQAWLLTMAAALSIAVSLVVAIAYYIGLRLRREPE